MVFGQMNEPPGNRLRVALTGLTTAEALRDEGRDAREEKREYKREFEIHFRKWLRCHSEMAKLSGVFNP